MTYIYNPGKAPKMFAHLILPPENYSVVTPDERGLLKSGGVDVIFEGDPDFVSPWVSSTNP
jgi:hypothetical protein